jgi:hypothetical protein
MGKKKGRKNGKGNKPEKLSQPINLTIFQPVRRVLVAAQAAVTSDSPSLILGFSSLQPPGSVIGSVNTFLTSFDRTRVVFIDVFFDQRASSAAVSRATCWVADAAASAYDATKLVDIANFAGSGMNQVIPGKRYRITVGPQYNSGRFGGTASSLIITTVGYEGTIRIETCFEAYGPPLDYKVTPAQENHVPGVRRPISEFM